MSTYLFTSNYQKRYQNDAVLTLAYPRGHILTFRYNKKYVAANMQAWARGEGTEKTIPRRHRDAFVVFADYVGGDDFLFYPLRKAKIVRLWTSGEVYFAALRLQDYVGYSNDNQPARFREWILRQANRPVPKKVVTAQRPDGSFILDCEDLSINPKVASIDLEAVDLAWQKIVESVASSPNLNGVVYWRVDGIYRLVGYQAFTPRVFEREKLIRPITSHAESRYRLLMGKNYVMKFITYIPGIPRPPCEIEFGSVSRDGAVVTPEKLTVSSRYNEDRVLIGCKRTLDGAFNPLEIRNPKQAVKVDALADDATKAPYSFRILRYEFTFRRARQRSAEKEAIAEIDDRGMHVVEGYLLIQIDVPRTKIVFILLLLASASVLLSVGPDMARDLGPKTWSLPENQRLPVHIATLCKALAAVIGIVAGYVTFRRLPLGK